MKHTRRYNFERWLDSNHEVVRQKKYRINQRGQRLVYDTEVPQTYELHGTTPADGDCVIIVYSKGDIIPLNTVIRVVNRNHICVRERPSGIVVAFTKRKCGNWYPKGLEAKYAPYWLK